MYSTTLPTVDALQDAARAEIRHGRCQGTQGGRRPALTWRWEGATLAAQAIRAGLVDEFHLLIAPVIAGGGLPYFPAKVPVKLELIDERKFGRGLVYVWYRTKS